MLGKQGQSISQHVADSLGDEALRGLRVGKDEVGVQQAMASPKFGSLLAVVHPACVQHIGPY